MIKIYVAGPYGHGDIAVNVKKAIDVGNELLDLGFNIYVPHLSHFLHMMKPRESKKWLEIDKEWLLDCDAMVRIDGYSDGADKEEELARKFSIYVFKTVLECVIHFNTRR